MRTFVLLLIFFCSVMSSGCRWNPFKRTNVDPSPVLFLNGQPTMQELTAAVNANTGRVSQLTSQGAVLRIPGTPPINADIALQRPLGFRFRAGTTFTGPEADFGSNNELFWFWIARAPQPALFFARHDQFANSPARAQLPVDPTWLVEALSLTEINPQQVWEGPLPIAEDRVEIRTRVPSALGELTKSIVIHNRFGWVLNQQLTDPRGQLVASSATSAQQYYPVDGVSLPQHVDINIPALQGAFAIDVDRWQVNTLGGDAQSLFALPRDQLRSYPLVDLTQPPGSSNQGPSAIPVNAPQAPPMSGPYGSPPPSAYNLVPNATRISSLPENEYRQNIRGLNSLR